MPFGCGKASNERAVLLQTANINATIAKNSILHDLCVMILKFIARVYEREILFCKGFVWIIRTQSWIIITSMELLVPLCSLLVPDTSVVSFSANK